MQSQNEQQQDGSSRQAGGQQAAEQAGTVFGVQNLQTKGGGEEAVQPEGNRLQSYGNLSQQVTLAELAYSASSMLVRWTIKGSYVLEELNSAGSFSGTCDKVV